MISLRLKTIAALIEKNDIVYDIGTDHGLLPIFLVKNNITDKVIASDNKKGPLNQAKENIERYNLQDKINLRLYDGIDASVKANVVVIAGMGANTIIDILSKVNLNIYKYIIIQSNKNNAIIRKYISDNHFTIVDEKICLDDKYYEIIKFNTSYHLSYSESDIFFGPINLLRKEELFLRYLAILKAKYQNLSLCKPEYQRILSLIEEMLNGSK